MTSSTSRKRRAGRAARRGDIELRNPIAVAMHGAAILTSAEYDAETDQAMATLQVLREGRGDVPTWSLMADVCNTAEALVELKIGMNLGPDVKAAQAALAAVMQRVHAGRGWTLYASEIEALTNAVDVFSAQLYGCSHCEINQARELVYRRISGALAGNAGKSVVIHADPREARP